MKTQKMGSNLKADFQLANAEWTVSQWIRWCLRNNVGIVIEDGKVTGYEEKPITVKM